MSDEIRFAANNYIKKFFESDEQEKSPEMVVAIARLIEALTEY